MLVSLLSMVVPDSSQLRKVSKFVRKETLLHIRDEDHIAQSDDSGRVADCALLA